MAKEIDFQEVQETQRVPKKLDPRRNTTKAHNNYITQDEIEGENLRSSKRKGHSYLQRSFSKETLQGRKGWREVFQVMKGKDLHPRLFCPAKLSFREWEGR